MNKYEIHIQNSSVLNADGSINLDCELKKNGDNLLDITYEDCLMIGGILSQYANAFKDLLPQLAETVAAKTTDLGFGKEENKGEKEIQIKKDE